MSFKRGDIIAHVISRPRENYRLVTEDQLFDKVRIFHLDFKPTNEYFNHPTMYILVTDIFRGEV